MLPSREREGLGEGLSFRGRNTPSPNPSREREGNLVYAASAFAASLDRIPSKWQIA